MPCTPSRLSRKMHTGWWAKRRLQQVKCSRVIFLLRRRTATSKTKVINPRWKLIRDIWHAGAQTQSFVFRLNVRLSPFWPVPFPVLFFLGMSNLSPNHFSSLHAHIHVIYIYVYCVRSRKPSCRSRIWQRASSAVEWLRPMPPLPRR